MQENLLLKVFVASSSIQGLGLFASRFIRKGEAILRIDDSRLVTPENPLHPDQGEFEIHCDFLENGRVILMKYPERHINHSCDPNAFVKTINACRYLFALHDIQPQDEITNDYCINGFGESKWRCRCGASRCRELVHADFFHLPLELQVEYLPILDNWYVRAYQTKVNQLINRILNLCETD